MDPPSFTKKMLMLEMQDCGQKITESEAKRFQQVLKDKAEVINAKLEKTIKTDVKDEMGLVEVDEVMTSFQDQISTYDLDTAIALIDQHES